MIEGSADRDEEAAADVVELPAAGGLATAVDAIAGREYRIATRRRLPTGIAAVAAALTVGVVALGGGTVGPSRPAAVLGTVVELSVYLVPLVGLVVGYDAVAGAAERGTLQSLLVLPVTRSQLVVGTVIGRGVALVSGLVVGFGIGGAALVVRFGPGLTAPYLRFVLASCVVALATLCVGVACSAWAGSTTRALAGALLAWVWFVLLYDLVAVGVVAALSPPPTAIDVLLVGNPATLLRVVALSGLPGGVALAGTPSPVAVGLGLAAWIVGPTALAIRGVARRAATA